MAYIMAEDKDVQAAVGKVEKAPWYMTETREMIRQAAREFAQTKIRPHIEKMELEDVSSKELVLEAGKLGFLGLSMAEEFGGSGEDFTSYALFLEEVGRESITVGTTCFFPFLFAYPLVMSGKCPQGMIDTVVKPSIQGDALLAICGTEGSGAVYTQGYQTTYEEDGDDVIINGSKMLISQVDVADYLIVCAKKKPTDGTPLTDVTVEFVIVPADAEGVKMGHIENKIGLHGSRTGSVYFENVRVSASNICGPQDAPFDINGFYGPIFLGAMEAVVEKTKNYLKERVQGGATLWDAHEYIRAQFGEMEMQIANFRNAVYGFMASRDNGVIDGIAGYALKVEGSELAEKIAGNCIELMGGAGTIIETGIERYYRDAKIMQVGCGANSFIRTTLGYFI